jgi:cell fate regulator YaaT (PSP1 superfamily)
MGRVQYMNEEVRNKEVLNDKNKIVRKATAHDTQKFDANKQRGVEAMAVCSKLALKYNLEMFPFYGMYSLDGTKVNIIFTADDRVDFRELVKELAKSLQKQIHLKQIGPRDKAKIVGGFGRCGRRLCCKGVLPNLESINMEMVRVQNLEGKGSAKLSGACGKLLCCLRYEAEAYKKLREGLPAIGSKVKLKKPYFGTHDEAYVFGHDVLNQKLRLDTGSRDLLTVEMSDIAKVMTKPISTAPSRSRPVEEEVAPAETVPEAVESVIVAAATPDETILESNA